MMKTAGQGVAVLLSLLVVGWLAYDIRMHAIRTFGFVIHEFDPWFNFRAAQYLADNGLSKFNKWYDYMSWSPLGRPIGTTIYPGMQIASVSIWRALNSLGVDISLNDACCYTPVWFGVLATMLLTAMVKLSTGRWVSALSAGFVMSIIPAHLMRSVGGGYDNESVAISAMLLTFLLWMKSVSGEDRDKVSLWGILTGIAYIGMVATWGGYIFVVNMIGLHAFLMLLGGRFSFKLYSAYSLWYVIGTLGAIQVPVVGLTPIRSLEQLAPMGVFFLMQILQLCETPAFLKLFKLERETLTPAQRMKLYTKVFGVFGVAAAAVIAVLAPTGYFGPLSSRIRGLFVQHTRTGNPLVDSVAEHQPVNPAAFYQFLQLTSFTAPLGFLIALWKSVVKPFLKPLSRDARTDSLSFAIVYAAVTYHFATKMNRLMLLMGPVSAILTGIAIGCLWDFCNKESMAMFGIPPEDDSGAKEASSGSLSNGKGGGEVVKEARSGKGGKNVRDKGVRDAKMSRKAKSSGGDLTGFLEGKILEAGNSSVVVKLRKVAAVVVAVLLLAKVPVFYDYCRKMSQSLSHPSLMFHSKTRDGQIIVIDDYREGYWWLRDNTPQDSRVMAWWDYGYQITGIGNRTTIADGNTWNHEHIALLGRCLTSPEERAHKIIRHLADYVLIWSGGGGDDLAKSPHMARIGNSVFEDICPGDPTCREFGFHDERMNPKPMMAASLLYKLHSYRIKPDAQVNETLFREVFMSKYGKLRIYQVVGVSRKSKMWAADPENRVCDAPGSWYCAGNYPPALNKTLAKKKDFYQQGDFNVKTDEKSKKYHEDYMKKMNQGQRPK